MANPNEITLDIHIIDQQRSYIAHFATEAQALDFIARRSATHAINELPEFPIPDSATVLLDMLYPKCIHGMSLWLCADPINHYPADNSY